jgi:hypothetical protein
MHKHGKPAGLTGLPAGLTGLPAGFLLNRGNRSSTVLLTLNASEQLCQWIFNG